MHSQIYSYTYADLEYSANNLAFLLSDVAVTLLKFTFAGNVFDLHLLFKNCLIGVHELTIIRIRMVFLLVT